MIKIPKEPSDVPRKQEDSSSNYEKAKASSASASASSSWSSREQQWVRLKDPRIVRVARSCGGKDRHSKVCTIRGLRDRRVRLSVPTAIQLYDLQERLGFNQPSKVIDWLLNAAKNDIDELPPLPPLDLALLHHHAILTSNNSSQPNNKEEAAAGWEASNNNTTFWKLIEPKEASSSHDDDVKQGSNNDNDQLSHHAVQVVPHHHHHHHHPSFVGYDQWEGSGSGGHRVSHQTDLQSINVVPFSSTLSLCTGDSSHHHHFASHFGANIDMDHNNNIPRQVNYNNHYPMMLQSSSSNLYPISSMAQSLNKPFGLSMMTPNNTSDQSHHQSHNHHLHHFPPK